MERELKISVAPSRKALKWKTKAFTWEALTEKLKSVIRTPESQEEFRQMPKSERDELKDVGGFVGGTLKGGRRKITSVLERNLITLDLDNVPAGADPWSTVSLIMGCAACLYSTHSHTDLAPRLRLVLPLSRPVAPDEYEAVARRVAGDIGIDLCDDTTFEPHRLMYWPSAPMDAPFRFEIQEGPWLDPDEYLRRYQDWRDPLQWPVSSRKQEDIARLAKKQGDPLAKQGVVGAFCRAYSIEDAIETFLPDVYIKGVGGRYTYAKGSTAGGLVLYENGKFAYSHHSTDPAGGKLCNAFDLVRIHLYGELDEDTDLNEAAQRKPSFKAMAELAVRNENVLDELKADQLDYIAQLFPDDEDEANDWVYLLELNTKTGKPAATIDNVFLILTHDPRIKSSYYWDEFKERPIVSGDLPWEALKDRVSDSWLDTDDAGLRHVLEKEYRIDSALKIKDAVDLAINSRKVHPVREYLRGLSWDGVKRADSLFIDYLGADDNKYTRAVTRKALLGAAARILRPGCKHDHMLVLIGPQGCRKSTTLAKLGREWFSDSLYTMSGKDAYEQLQGSWIIELAEMAATRKAEVEAIKQFVSKQEDTYRAAYARRTQTHPRQCAFFGTTNDEEFLRDMTGARRFWPVVVTEIGKEKGDLLTGDTVDQIWAEIVEAYDSGEQWYLDAETEELARKVQAEHTEISGKLPVIEQFLERLLPDGWNNYTIEERLTYWSGDFGVGDTGKNKRMRVCGLEVWTELFKGSVKDYTQTQARELMNLMKMMPGWRFSTSVDCGKPYGRQRGFVRTLPKGEIHD